MFTVGNGGFISLILETINDRYSFAEKSNVDINYLINKSKEQNETYFKIQVIAALAFLTISCQKNEDFSFESKVNTNHETIDAIEAEQQFAVILSKAVAANENLRAFIKEQALVQFDNDYDVFYPYVKNMTIPQTSSTFRDMLIGFAESENQIITIETSLPKLTILVPDYSWVNKACFSVSHWDTASDKVLVGFDDMQDEHLVYYSGEEVGRMPADEFPEFPVLIVKDNERINATAATKSGDILYSFVSPTFDGSKKHVETKSKGNYGLWGDIDEVLENTEDGGPNLLSKVGNKISASELLAISPETINAYNEFGSGWNNACQRDFIYYRMSKTNTDNGVLYKRERDLLYRFALNTAALFSTDDAEGEDPTGMKTSMELRNADLPNCADAVRRMWANGKYELQIDIYQKANGGSANKIDSYIFDINPADLMYVTKCDRNYRWNILGQSWNTYSLQEAYVEPKWFYPADGFLPVISNNWDMATDSDNIYIVINEIDESVTTQTQTTTNFKQSFSVTATQQNEMGATLEEVLSLKRGLGVSGTYGQEKTTTNVITISKTEKSDDLGACSVEFIDNIVTGRSATDYYLKRYGTGKFFFSLIPVDMMNELAVTNYLDSHH